MRVGQTPKQYLIPLSSLVLLPSSAFDNLLERVLALDLAFEVNFWFLTSVPSSTSVVLESQKLVA